MYSLPISETLAALTIASAASIEPIRPFVSMSPSASLDIARGAPPPHPAPLPRWDQYCAHHCTFLARAAGGLASDGLARTLTNCGKCSNCTTLDDSCGSRLAHRG